MIVTIVNTIYNIHEADKIIFPEASTEDDEFYGWDFLTFNSYSSENGGTVLCIKRSIVPNPDSWEHVVKVELLFENVPFEKIRYVSEPVDNVDADYDFISEINNCYSYSKVKTLIPNQFKVRTEEF